MEKAGTRARSSVVAMLLASTPACDLDDTGSIEIEDTGEVWAPAGDTQELLGHAEALPAPNGVWLESISTFGVGCPLPDSALGEYSSANKSISLTFEDMLLQNPGGFAVKTINCVASVKLNIPSGWQMSVATINTKGRAFLETGIKTRNTTNYFFAGDPTGYSAHTLREGPYNARYTFTDQIPPMSVSWSPCGSPAIFIIDTSLILNAISNPAGSAVNKVSKNELQIQFQQC